MTQKSLTNYTGDKNESHLGTNTDKFVPDTCIGFDVGSDFAHFRKVGNNSAKPSYRVPPRTTLAGMLAGILGMDRDSYYDLFSEKSSAIAVVPKEFPHTYTMGITTVNTNPNTTIKYLPKNVHYTKGEEMLTPESYVKEDRQRDTYEMLVDPVYRVYVALDDEDIHNELLRRLDESQYYYSPSLGLSECIADIRNVDTHSVESTTVKEIDSIAYDDTPVLPSPGVTIKRERAQLYMEAIDGGRRTTEFGNITYTTDGSKLPVDASRTYSVGPHNVIFY